MPDSKNLLEPLSLKGYLCHAPVEPLDGNNFYIDQANQTDLNRFIDFNNQNTYLEGFGKFE